MFASEESKFAEIYNVPAGPTKQKLFAPLDKIQSADWDLKNKGLIRILEIGCGNGNQFDRQRPEKYTFCLNRSQLEILSKGRAPCDGGSH